jgi:hypothetical protein
MENETVSDFTKGFLNRLQNADVEDKQSKLNYYITALRDDIRRRIIALKPETLEAAEQDALIAEKLIDEEKPRTLTINAIEAPQKNVSFAEPRTTTDTRNRSYSRDRYSQNRDRRENTPTRNNSRDRYSQDNRSRSDRYRPSSNDRSYDRRDRQRSQSFDRNRN